MSKSPSNADLRTGLGEPGEATHPIRRLAEADDVPHA